MNKKSCCFVIALGVVATAHGQLTQTSSANQVNVNGLGTLVDQLADGGSSIQGNKFSGFSQFDGTYLNPRADEEAAMSSYQTSFITVGRSPEELSNLKIQAAGTVVNTAGYLSGSTPNDVIYFQAFVDEVLGDGTQIPTGYGVAVAEALTGDGVLTIPQFATGTNTFAFLLRPRTNYVVYTGFEILMGFSDTATTPSQGVTLEFGEQQQGAFMQSGFTFQALPEPPSLAILGLGALPLLIWRRRR